MNDHQSDIKDSETKAIRRLKRGDIGGLEELVTRYQEKAVRTAFLVTQDQALAEEVVQETFVRIFKRSHQFDESRPFEPYLLRSIVNAAVNEVKRRKKWETQQDNEEDFSAMELLLDQAASVETQAERNQLKKEISDAVVRLSPRQRVVIVQKYYLGLSEKEMADELQAAAGTVKWLLHAARRRLRQLLGSQRSSEND
jgi:RNA polymerase sigma-70 factor (ECF subfamily)